MYCPRSFLRHQTVGAQRGSLVEFLGFGGQRFWRLYGPVREQELRQISFLDKCDCWIHVYSIKGTKFCSALEDFY